MDNFTTISAMDYAKKIENQERKTKPGGRIYSAAAATAGYVVETSAQVKEPSHRRCKMLHISEMGTRT
jgi:hypothetical protein